MLRLAWFTPLPPVKSGIARYSSELLRGISAFHNVDIFVDGPPSDFVAPDSQSRLFAAHDFVWKNRREQYDLVVYQLGNAPCHDYMWAYLFRYPGLVVLHDGQLHHARARLLLQQKRYEHYRQEFWFNHPDAHPDLPELGIQGLLGSLTYCWPMLRTVVESSRLIAVHNDWLADRIRQTFSRVTVQVVEMGVPQPVASPDARETVRTRHRIPAGDVLFLSLGKVTPEKRIGEAIRALAALSEPVPPAHLLLAGETVDYYDPAVEAGAAGIADRVSVAGYLADADIDDYIAASDVCLCMRWPTSRETSASWLRCLAAGRPTVTTDLVHTVDVPTLDARDESLLGSGKPVGVSVDILDEGHSLRLAMRTLAEDADLRDTLGTNARELWSGRFRLEQMVESYRRLIDLAATAPFPREEIFAAFPEHLVVSGVEHSEAVLREAGFPESVISTIRLQHLYGPG